MTREERIAELYKAAEQRILILDGGMGTMLQAENFTEDDFRGDFLKDHPSDVKGDSELIALTRPEILRGIHLDYYRAGADLAEANTFGATRIAQGDYDLEHLAYEMNVKSVQVAREAADMAQAEDGRLRWVIGVLGPTPRSASISPDVNDPSFRNVDFDDLYSAYREAAEGLLEGGADLIMIETIFDTLNAKTALFVLQDLFDELGYELPIMISGTITDAAGRILSGQTPEAFWYSVRHANPFSVGLNCALGAEQLRQYVDELSRVADTRMSAHPNAGLPNEFGGYDQSPEYMAELVGEFAKAGLLNIAGGCCGTTPEHIRAIAEAVAPYPPRDIPRIETKLRLSGIEPFVHA